MHCCWPVDIKIDCELMLGTTMVHTVYIIK